MDPETALRKTIYEITLQNGVPPLVTQLSNRLGASDADVRDGLERLANARVVVLQRSSRELLMVPPFSAVPTPFVVSTRGYQTYANCAWDAFGVPIMLDDDAEITSACGCCGESITLEAFGKGPPFGTAVMHFAVPAQRWWDDIVFT
jgi:hypothetical protein